MNVTPIFINFLATESLKLDNGAMEKFALGLKTSSPGRMVSNAGGWQSNNLDLKAPELRPLLEAVDSKLNELHTYFNLSPTKRQAIAEGWININNRGGFNLAHNHPGSFFSCVYYLKGGEKKGNVEFTNPIEAHAYTIHEHMVSGYNAFTGHAISIPPITGELLIFPSWLMHFVRPNETDEDRISIALNSGLIDA